MKNKHVLLWVVAAFVLLAVVLWFAGARFPSSYIWPIAIGALMIVHCWGMSRHHGKDDEGDTSATHDDNKQSKKQHGGCCH